MEISNEDKDMSGNNAVVLSAAFRAHPDNEIALSMAANAMQEIATGIGPTVSISSKFEASNVAILKLQADSQDNMEKLIEGIGPHVDLLSKSAVLMSLDVIGDLSDSLKSGLAPFSPTFHRLDAP